MIRIVRPQVFALLLSLYFLSSGWGSDSAPPPAQPPPPNLGPGVTIFDPPTGAAVQATTTEMQTLINNIYAQQMRVDHEFVEARYALLFKPGQYDLDVKTGYYTQISGLGLTPDAVTINGAVRTQDDPATNPINEGPTRPGASACIVSLEMRWSSLTAPLRRPLVLRMALPT